jgi:Tfp pilus assembly protein PilX
MVGVVALVVLTLVGLTLAAMTAVGERIEARYDAQRGQ